MLSISGVPANVSDGYVYNRTFCYQADEDIHQDFVNKTGEYLEISTCKIYRTVVVEQFGTEIIANNWELNAVENNYVQDRCYRGEIKKTTKVINFIICIH